MLSFVVIDYIEAFDEQPLPADVAEETFRRLLDVVEQAENSLQATASEQISVLNRIAAERLLEPQE